MGSFAFSISFFTSFAFDVVFYPSHVPWQPAERVNPYTDSTYGYCYLRKPFRLHGRHYMLRRRAGFRLIRKKKLNCKPDKRDPTPQTPSERTRLHKRKRRNQST